MTRFTTRAKLAIFLAIFLTGVSPILAASQCVNLFNSSARNARIEGEAMPQIWDLKKLEQARDHGSPAASALIIEAQKIISQPALSVMNKEAVPPSGDKHDYISISLYLWPNPETKNGLPYIKRDGEPNPNLSRSHPDADNFWLTRSRIKNLSIAYKISGDESFAIKASQLLRTWFIDPETRMNPNMKFAQGHPGKSNGDPWGIIELAECVELFDAIKLLETSKNFSAQDKMELRSWFGEMLEWLRTSELGQEEGSAPNNHGTWFDAELASMALFVGRIDIAKAILEQVGPKRISTQIAPDGSQIEELKRTRSLHYSIYNLRAFFLLARLGEKVGVDIWNYQSEDHRSLSKALQFVIPAATSKASWPFQQIDKLKEEDVNTLIMLANGRLIDQGVLSKERFSQSRASLIF